MNSSLKFLNFSPSTRSSLNNPPLAESTAMGSPIYRQLHATSKRKSISPLHNPSKLRSTVKIDPHVLTDAQSSGIVSRLVKYYDHSASEPERSRIVYNKFGDFPIVQLKKTELKRPIVRSTSVRIAPPSKLIMNPTIRSAIMRSNSFSLSSGVPKIIPTKMRAKDDSHQIIRNHEPIIDTNFSVSSKSVLDALEKNCRKRINNEELNLDRSKKFCIPLSTSEVDAPAMPREFIPISSPPMSAKRTRDISPIKSTSIFETSQPSKRIKTRNNALLSSLSSSHYNLIPYASNASINHESIQRRQTTLSEPTSSSAIRNQTTKPLIMEDEDDRRSKEQLIRKTSSQESELPTLPSVAEIHHEIAPVETQRKLHLFNVKPDPSRCKAKQLENNDDDEDDEAKIRFVKPKPAAIENYETNEHPRKYQLTKMLSGLSTGYRSPPSRMNVKEKDTVDASEEKQKSDEKTQSATAAASISFVTSTTSSTIAPISSPTTSSVVSISSTSSLKLPETKNTLDKPAESAVAVAITPSSTETTVSSIASNLPKPTFGGFQFGSAATTTATSEASKNLINFTPVASNLVTSTSSSTISTVTSTSSSLTTDQNKPLISFTPIVKSTSSESAVSSSLTTTTALPTFGSTNNTNSSNGGGFSFGTSTEQSKLGITAPGEGGGGFNFGNNSNTNTNASVAATIKPPFSFGSNQSALPKIPVSTPSLTASLLPPIPSAQPAVSINLSNATSTVSSSSSGGFSFGSSTASQGIGTFGVGSSIAGIASLAKSPTFSKPETTVASGIGFSFGGANKPAMTFGSNSNTVAATSTTSSFSFGGGVQTAQSSPIGFSAPTVTPVAPATPSPSFSFGSSTANAQQPNTGFTGFGSIAPKTDAQPTAGIFSFSQQQKASPATPSFNFNASNAVPTTQPSSAFAFNKSQEESKASGIFSRLGSATNEVKPFSFNANTNASQQNSSNPFGGSNAPVATSASIFNQPAFGQSSIIGSNNGGNSNLFSQGNQNAPSVFGGNTQLQTQQQQPQPSSNMFSFNSSQNDEQKRKNQFNFGTSNATPSANIFGAAVNTNSSNSTQNVSASFTFNPNTGGISSSSSSQSVFGQNQLAPAPSSAPPPPAYQFGSSANGGSSNANGSNVNVSFNFSGAAASAPTPQTNSNAFNFGSSAPSSAPGAGGAFNFQAQNQQQQQQNAGGVFNIGTGGNQRRFIRTASRRFK